MANKMLIDAAHPEETRVVVVRGQRVEEFDFESAQRKPLRGNIYLAKVMRVEPSLQAAFVDYGGNRHGFLAFSEIHPDYYQIPVADREALIAEEARSARESDDDEPGPRRARGRGPAAARNNRDDSISTSQISAPEESLSEESTNANSRSSDPASVSEPLDETASPKEDAADERQEAGEAPSGKVQSGAEQTGKAETSRPNENGAEDAPIESAGETSAQPEAEELRAEEKEREAFPKGNN